MAAVRVEIVGKARESGQENKVSQISSNKPIQMYYDARGALKLLVCCKRGLQKYGRQCRVKGIEVAAGTYLRKVICFRTLIILPHQVAYSFLIFFTSEHFRFNFICALQNNMLQSLFPFYIGTNIIFDSLLISMTC